MASSVTRTALASLLSLAILAALPVEAASAERGTGRAGSASAGVVRGGGAGAECFAGL